MAEEKETPEELLEEEQQESPEKGSKKLLYIISASVLLIFTVVMVWFLILPEYRELSEIQQETGELEEKANEDSPQEIGHLYKIENITINPKGSDGTRFAVFELALEVREEEDLESLKKYNTVIIDNFISYFRSKTVAQLTNENATDLMKADLQNLGNEILGHGAISRVFFTRFVLE